MSLRRFKDEKFEKLQALTEKFLDEFLELASENDGKERKKDRNSYNFNHTLPDVLAETKHAKKDYYDYPFIGSGFTKNIVEQFFVNNLQGFDKDIVKLIENFDNQDRDYNYFAENLVIKENVETSKKFKSSTKEGGELKVVLEDVQVKSETTTFEVVNTGSGFQGTVKLFKEETEIFEGEKHLGKGMKLKEINFYKGKNELIFSIRYTYDGFIEPTIQHFKYCADINSMHGTINAISFKKKKK